MGYPLGRVGAVRFVDSSGCVAVSFVSLGSVVVSFARPFEVSSIGDAAEFAVSFVIPFGSGVEVFGDGWVGDREEEEPSLPNLFL